MARQQSSERATSIGTARWRVERRLLWCEPTVSRFASFLSIWVWTCLVVGPVFGWADANPASAEPSVRYVGERHRVRNADPREDADRALAAGRFHEARELYGYALDRDPDDRHALREAGRAAHALRDFPSAAELLGRASALTFRHDPELHYLLGEARWVLGRTELARQAYRRVAQELGPAPPARIEKLWLARVHDRLGDRAAAEALYEALTTAEPDDPEIALAHAEFHATAAEWAAAEREARRILSHTPRHPRALAMLAWILETRGDVAAELPVRAALAQDEPTAETVRDYGRALERAGHWAGALTAYRLAAALPDGAADLELARALARIDQRMAVELGAGMSARRDPTASALGLVMGAAIPFGRSSHWAISAWHELVQSDTSDARGVYAGEIQAAAVLRKLDAFAIIGARVGVVDVLGDPGRTEANWSVLRPGALLSASSGALAGHVELVLDVELNSLWRETPRAELEGGKLDAATARMFAWAFGRRLVFDGGAQARRLQLTSDAGADPRATQLLAWAGADLVVWRDFTREARGQILDTTLLRPTFAADSAVLGYRHYELRGASDSMFAARLPLADRASIDEVSITLRKVIARGRVMAEASGGAGRDHARDLFLSRGSAALWLAPSPRSRLSVSFELAKESVRAFEGERRTGWVSYHVDL
jgi:tetratricopeptide (TPR) repeat protein